MQHKLIMENWRKHLKELDLNPVMGTTDMANAVYTSKALTPKQRLKYNKSQRELAQGNIPLETAKLFTKAGIILVKEIGLLFEPSGQVADIDVDTGKVTYTYELVNQSSAAALDAYRKGDYLSAGLNSAAAALGVLAMIPIAGKAAKGMKRLIPTKRVKSAEKIMDHSQKLATDLKATGHPELVAKSVEIEESLEQIYDFRKSLKKTKVPLDQIMLRLRKASRMLLSPIKTKIAKRVKAGSLKINTKLNIKLRFNQEGINFDDFAADFWGMGTGTNTFTATTRDGSKIQAYAGISNLKISFIPERMTDDLRVSGGFKPALTQRGTYVQLDFYIPDRLINADGTIKPQALEEMFDQANEAYMHELFHSFQKNEKFKSSKKQSKLDDLDGSDYAKYRATDDEVQAWAIEFAGRENYMNRDALTSMWDSLSFNPGMTQKELALRTQILIRQVKFAIEKFPCMRGSWELWKPILELSRDEGLKAKFSDFYKLEAAGKINNKTLIPFGNCKKFRHFKGRGKVGAWNDKKLNKEIREYLERIIQEELQIILKERGSKTPPEII